MTPTEPDPDSSTPDPPTADGPARHGDDEGDDATAYSTGSTELRRLRSLLG